MKTLQEILNSPQPKVKDNLSAIPIIEIKPCPKCQGTGILPSFQHIKNGKCFQCNGKGKITQYNLPSERR